jgi:hypothetical protein
MLSGGHELADGGHVRLRLTRPSDGPLVHAFLERVSEGTHEGRFLFYDPRDRIVMAATTADGGMEEIVGLAEASLLDSAAPARVLVGAEARERGVDEVLSEAIEYMRLRALRRRAAA